MIRKKTIHVILITLLLLFVSFSLESKKSKNKKWHKKTKTAKTQKKKSKKKKKSKLLNSTQKENLKKTLLYSPSSVRIQALSSLKRLEKSDRKMLFPTIKKLIQSDPDPMVRAAACKAAAALEMKDKVLIKALKDKSEEVSRQAVYAIKKLKMKNAAGSIFQKLKEAEFEELNNFTISLIDTMSTLQSKLAENFAIKKIDSDKCNVEFKQYFILYLGNIKSKKARKIIRKMLLEKTNPLQLRCYAANALGKIGVKSDVKILKKEMKKISNITKASKRKRFSRLQRYIMRALVLLGDNSHLDLLLAGIRDDNASMRIQSLKYLGELKKYGHIPSKKIKQLKEMLDFVSKHDSSSKVKKTAKEVLEKLNNKSVKKKKYKKKK